LKAGIVPEVISVTKAVSETVAFLRDLDTATNNDVSRSLRAELRNSAVILRSARSRLRTACATRNLTVIVVEPGSGSLRALPGEYFNRPSSSSVFENGKPDLSALENGDPVYDFVAFADGRQCALLAPDFFEWLRDRWIGAAVEPPLLPFFNMSALESPSLRIGENYPEPPTERAAVEVTVAASAIAPGAERIEPPVVEANYDKPKPSKQKERQKVREAIEALVTAPDWIGLKGDPRMRRIEKHLGWLDGQCKRRTYNRALDDIERARLAVAPVGEVAQVPDLS
jgi:hypothetical protein